MFGLILNLNKLPFNRIQRAFFQSAVGQKRSSVDVGFQVVRWLEFNEVH